MRYLTESPTNTVQCIGVVEGRVCCVALIQEVPKTTAGRDGVVEPGSANGVWGDGAVHERQVRVKIPGVEVHEETHGYESSESYGKECVGRR